MFLMIPLDHSGLFEFLSGFLSYSTWLPRLNGTNSLLPFWYLVESSLHNLALCDKSLACYIIGILVLKCLLHKSSTRLLSIPVMGADFKINKANQVSPWFLTINCLMV